MGPSSTTLALTLFWQKEKLVVVRAIDSIRLCRDEGFELLPQVEVEAHLARALRRDRNEVRDFVLRSRLTRSSPTRFDDLQVISLLRRALKGADLVVVRESGAKAVGQPASKQQRDLVRAVDAKTRGRLDHEGRRYLLVAGADLGRVPNRDSYQVVPQREAAQVLDAAASRTGDTALAHLLRKARALLARDWRSPLVPDGLVLLRGILQPVAATGQAESALTPSQLKKLSKSEWDVAPSAVHEESELELGAEKEDHELETGATVEPESPEGEEESPTDASDGASSPAYGG
jgi:hypothetical protein